MSSQDVIPCSVCVTAYNEEENIGSLLAALLDQHVHEVEICEIVVVASACTDNTVPIVREFMAKDPRIVLIEQERREGKTAAINEFLAVAKCEVCVIESGDTIPHEYAVEHMVRMFKDPTVGMVGAQKVAVNTPDHIAGLLSHLRLHGARTLPGDPAGRDDRAPQSLRQHSGRRLHGRGVCGSHRRQPRHDGAVRLTPSSTTPARLPSPILCANAGATMRAIST
ncbi:MAG: glycosyltransferase family 2 protein [Caldilineaceae bacterium]